MKRIIILFMLVLTSAAALSSQSIIVETEEAEMELDLDYTHVVRVKAVKTGESWRFDVTLRHGDSGWDHYADLWVVADADTGAEYGRRVLAHPHVNEQPFTRSRSGIVIPESVDAVVVKAACNVHGFGGTEAVVKLK